MVNARYPWSLYTYSLSSCRGPYRNALKQLRSCIIHQLVCFHSSLSETMSIPFLDADLVTFAQLLSSVYTMAPPRVLNI